MKKASLQKRITILSVLLSALILLLLTLFFAWRDEELFIRQNRSLRLHLSETLAISITNALLYEELGLIEEGGLIENYIDEWMHTPDLHVRMIRVLSPEGRVIASSNLRDVGRTIQDSTVLHHLDQLATSSRHVTSADGEPVIEVFTPLNISTRSWGLLTVDYSLRPMMEELRHIRIESGLVALGLIALIAVVLAIYVRSAFAPLKELQMFVGQVPKQSWFRTPVRRNDEIGDLAVSFNEMLDELEQVREKEREAQEKFHYSERVAMVGKLAAGVAHEVRNPLAGIGTLVENLARYRENDAKFEQYTDAIHKGLGRIERIVAGLISLSHQTPFNPRPTNPVQVVQDVLELAGYALRKARVQTVWKVDEPVPQVLADGDQLRQVILNLVLNAARAMDEQGGRLTVGVQRGEPGFVKLYIEDEGIGIPRENLTKVFDPFFSTLPVGEGSGLGLAVSRSILDRHRGRIEVASEEGKGARFTLVLPEAPAKADDTSGGV